MKPLSACSSPSKMANAWTKMSSGSTTAPLEMSSPSTMPSSLMSAMLTRSSLVEAIALSSDTEERAAQAKSDWKLDNLTIGYGLSLDSAREWGLYISAGIGKTSIGVEEPALFSEPGLFLVRPDGTIYFGSVQTMPFARPAFAEILGATKFVLERGYPARGEVTDHASAQAAE